MLYRWIRLKTPELTTFLPNPCVLNDFTCGSCFRISPEVCAAHKDMVCKLFISEKGVESETEGVFLTWKLWWWDEFTPSLLHWVTSCETFATPGETPMSKTSAQMLVENLILTSKGD